MKNKVVILLHDFLFDGETQSGKLAAAELRLFISRLSYFIKILVDINHENAVTVANYVVRCERERERNKRKREWERLEMISRIVGIVGIVTIVS